MFGFAQVDIDVPHKFYDKFGKMAPLFVVQEIPDCYIPQEMKIYKEKTDRKTVKGTQVTGCYEDNKYYFVRSFD